MYSFVGQFKLYTAQSTKGYLEISAAEVGMSKQTDPIECFEELSCILGGGNDEDQRATRYAWGTVGIGGVWRLIDTGWDEQRILTDD